MQTGFRAPSLQQQFFQTTSTNFIGGLPFDVTTFPATDPIAQAMGAQELDAEESIDFSVGAVLRLGEVDITIDAYRIDIDDRIVLSENLTSPAVRNFLTNQGFIGVGGGRFFINGVDTETQGVDLVVNWPVETGVGRFDFTFTANYNETDVTRVPSTPQLAALSPPPVLFDRFNILTFEEGTPKDKLSAQVSWNLDRLGATLRAIRYGEVLSPDSCRDVRNGGAGTRSGRHRARRQDAGGSGRPLRPDRQHPAGDRRGEPVRRVSGPEHAARQPDRHDLVLELLAVRALGTVRVRRVSYSSELEGLNRFRLASSSASPLQPQHTPSRRPCCD